MATCFLTEYADIAFVGRSSNHHVPVPSLAAVLAYNSISLSGTTALASTQLTVTTRFIKVCSDTNCWINFGTTSGVTAVATDEYIPANVPLFFAVNPGGYIAGIT